MEQTYFLVIHHDVDWMIYTSLASAIDAMDRARHIDPGGIVTITDRKTMAEHRPEIAAAFPVGVDPIDFVEMAGGATAEA